MSENTVEIAIKVKDAAQAAAEMTAVESAAKRVGAAGGDLGGVSRGMEDIGRSSEGAARSMGLSQDAAGRWRNELGQFATDAEKAAAGIENVDRKTDAAGRSSRSAGDGFSFGASRLGLLASAAMVVAPALAAIPALAVGAAAGIGVLAGAFTGVIGALHDYAKQQDAAAASGASGAATAYSNAIAIRNAEQAIADAKARAAQAAVTSAREIADAQQSLSDAERQAALSAQSSVDAVAAADRRLTSAQQTLTQVQRDGVNVLKDINLAAEGAANSVADAQLRVQEAQENASKAAGNSLLTDRQKQQAAQDLVDAQFQLKEAQQKQTEAQQAADDANAKGVQGSQAVVSATQGVADAQQALAKAQKDQANQKINSDESVAKAQQHLADAYNNSAKQQADSARQVKDAEQALTDTRREQALAAAQAGVANDKFAKDMAKLTQPGRDFVLQVLSMKDRLHDLSVTAQEATLPGFTQMLRDSQGMFPVVNQGIKDMGGAIGGAALKFGDLMKSPAFQGDMQRILKQAADFTTRIADGLVGMLGGVADAAAGAGPIVDALGRGFEGIMKTGIPAFFKGLTINSKGSGEAIQSLLDLVTGLLGPIGTLVGALAGALGPAFHDLVPHMVDFVDAIVQQLLPNMPAFSQFLDHIAVILGQILLIAQPLMPLFGQDFKNALKILNPLLGGLAKLLEGNHGWLGQVAKVLLELVSPIHLTLTALGWLADHFDSLKETVKQWIADVKKWWNEAGTWLSDKWHKIGEDAAKAWKAVYDNTVKPVKDAYDWLTGKNTGFGAVVKWIEGLPSMLARAGSGLWDWVTAPLAGLAGTIAQTFKNVINGVILGINWVIDKANAVTQGGIGGFLSGLLGLGSPAELRIDHIPTLHASGGPFGGLSAILGEAGVEMMRLPDGTVAMPHANTMSAIESGAVGGGGRSGGAFQLEFAPGAGHGDPLLEWLREVIRVRGGGNVQAALGQRF